MRKYLILIAAMMFLPDITWAQQMTIDELFRQVKDNSKRIKVSTEAVDIADHDIAVAKAQRLPDVNAQLVLNYNGDGFITDRDFSNYTRAAIPHFGNNFALEASQAVYTGGAMSSGIRMAEIGKQKAEAALQQTLQQMCFVALGQYLEIYKNDNQMEVYRNNIALTKKLISNVKAKCQQGTALKNDVTRYELQLEDQGLELEKLNNNRTIINHQLCTLLGCADCKIIPDTTIINTAYGREAEQNWQNKASASSPLLRQTALDIDMSKQQSRLAKSELMPMISVVAADNLNGPIMIEVPPINKNFNYWYLGVGVKYSISSLFKSNKKIKRAQAAEVQSAEQHKAMSDEVENSVQSAYTLYQQSYVELATQQKSVQLAQQNYDVIDNRYMNGLALVTDMVDAENTKLSAELQEVNARIGVVYAYYKMKYVSGTL
jgi:outer membrane protein